MFRYSKLNSVQAGPFQTPSNRMIDLEIPEGIVCNMANSFVQLRLRLATDIESVENLCPKSTTSDFVNMNIDLIRNCSLMGSKVGRLEDIRRVNVLKHNLNLMSKSSNEKLSLVDSLYQMTNFYSNQLISIFVDMNKEGTVASTYRDVYLRIPLKDLFELGSLEALDTSKTGKLTLHLELENSSYIEVEQVKLMNDTNEGLCNNVASGANLAELITTYKYKSLEISPFFVGQVLNLSATRSGGTVTNPTNVSTTITGIAKNIDGSLTLTISPALPDPGSGNSWTVITLVEPTISTADTTIQVATAELGLSEIVGGSQSVDELNYMTFTTEEYTNGAQQTMNKIFEVEPECVNAFLMFDNNSSNLISNNVGVTSYRMRVDNEDVYNRDIIVNKSNSKQLRIHDALHYDSVYRTFLNANYPLKDMSFLSLKRNVGTGANNNEYKSRFTVASQQIMVCCCPTPLTPLSKKLQFNVVANKDSGSKVENVILYKQVMRSVKF
jgi:hypothetical protein